MYDAFLFWSEHKNSEVRHAGFMALNAFLQQISDMLVQRADKKQSTDKAVFKVGIEQKGKGLMIKSQNFQRAFTIYMFFLFGETGTSFFRALASQAGNFEKLLTRNCLYNLPSAHNRGLLDYWKKVPASRYGTYQTLSAHHENCPPLAGGRVLMSSPVNVIRSTREIP